MRKGSVFVAIVVALSIAVELAVRTIGVSFAEDALSDAFREATSIDLQLDEPLVTIALLRGTMSMTVQAHDLLLADAAQVRGEATFVLRDVDLAESASGTTVVSDGGTATITVGESQMQKLLRAELPDNQSFSFAEDAILAMVESPAGTLTISLGLVPTADGLAFEVRGVDGAADLQAMEERFAGQLPIAIPDGVVVDSVDIDPARITLRATLPARLSLDAVA